MHLCFFTQITVNRKTVLINIKVVFFYAKKKLNLKAATAIQTIEKGFGDFILHCKTKNLSTVTIEDYHRNFNMFTNYYNGDYIEEISETTVRGYVLFLQKRDISTETVNCYLRHLRAVLNYWSR